MSPNWRSPLPVPGGGQLLLLKADLAGGAVPGVGHGADQVLAPLVHPLLVLPLLVKAVQKGGEGGEGDAGDGGAVLADGLKGKVGGMPLLFQHDRCKAIFLHRTQEPFQLIQQPRPAPFPHLMQPRVGGSPRPESQLTADEGGEAAEGVQQPLGSAWLSSGCGGQGGLQGGAVQGGGGQLLLGGGRR